MPLPPLAQEKHAQVLGSWASSNVQPPKAPAPPLQVPGSAVGAFGPVPKTRSSASPKDSLRGTMIGVGAAPPPAMPSYPPGSARPSPTSAVPIGLAPPPAMSASPSRAEARGPALSAPSAAGGGGGLASGNQPTVPVMQAVLPEALHLGGGSDPMHGVLDPAPQDDPQSGSDWGGGPQRDGEDETEVNVPLAGGAPGAYPPAQAMDGAYPPARAMDGAYPPARAMDYEEKTPASWPAGDRDSDGVESAKVVAADGEGGSAPYDDPLLDSVMPPAARTSGGFDLSAIEQWELPEVPRPPSGPSARRFSAQPPPEPTDGGPMQVASMEPQARSRAPRLGSASVLSPRSAPVLTAATRAELAEDPAYGRSSSWGKRLLWGGLVSVTLVAGVMFGWPLWETVAPVRVPAAPPARPVDVAAAAATQQGSAPANAAEPPGAAVSENHLAHGPGGPNVAEGTNPPAAVAAEGAPALADQGAAAEAVEKGGEAVEAAAEAPPLAAVGEDPEPGAMAERGQGESRSASIDDPAAEPGRPDSAREALDEGPRAADRSPSGAAGADDIEPDIQALARERPAKVIARAQAMLRAARPERAEGLLRALLARRPQDHHVMEVLVQALLAQDRGAEGVQMAQFMVQRRPRRASYYALLGRALLAAGSEREGKAALRRALALDPSNRAARHFLGPSEP